MDLGEGGSSGPGKKSSSTPNLAWSTAFYSELEMSNTRVDFYDGSIWSPMANTPEHLWAPYTLWGNGEFGFFARGMETNVLYKYAGCPGN